MPLEDYFGSGNLKVDRYYTNRYNSRMIDNRKVILDCALELFAIRGYDAVGVQEIVDAAGITKPTLYHYFGSKHGLLEEVLSEHFGSLNKEVEEAAQYERGSGSNVGKDDQGILWIFFQVPCFLPLDVVVMVCSKRQ